MTLEQQLQDFASNPVAGGVRWEVKNTGLHQWTLYYKSRKCPITICIVTNMARMVHFLFPDGIYLSSQTIREACEEAISLVKSRAKEIYEAFGGFNVHIKHDPTDKRDDMTNIVFVNQNGDTLTTSNTEIIDFLTP